MIRIGRIFDQVTDAERRKMDQVQAIFRKVFTAAKEYADRIPQLLTQRQGLGYDVILLTAEGVRERVLGFLGRTMPGRGAAGSRATR